MREILFRGKVDGESKWVEGSYVKQYGTNEIYLRYGIDVFGLESRHVDPATVGQFTGMVDKYGKRIFEGDIVQSGELVYKVKYDTQKAAFVLSDYKEERTFCLSQQALDYYKIIGNIYDNPKLMTRK